MKRGIRKLRNSLYHPSGEVYALGGQELSNPLKNAYVSGRMGKDEMLSVFVGAGLPGCVVFGKSPGSIVTPWYGGFVQLEAHLPLGVRRYAPMGLKLWQWLRFLAVLAKKF